MKRYVKASRTETIEYEGYFIEYNTYGEEEYTVEVDGEDVWCNTLSEAQAFIDDLNLVESVNKKLGFE